MPKIFVSYCHTDIWIMRFLVNYLRSHGFDIWVDEQREEKTGSLSKEIEVAIENTPRMLVICTPQAKRSEWVEREIAYAEVQHCPITPVLASGEPRDAISVRLIHLQWIDIKDSNFDEQMKSLVRELHNHIPSELRIDWGDESGIRWERVGSVYWFASDCRELRALLKYSEEVTPDVKQLLLQIPHHARRLEIDKQSLEWLTYILEGIRNLSYGDWNMDDRILLEEKLRMVSNFIAGRAERADPGYIPYAT